MFPKRGLSKKEYDEKKKKHEQEKEAAKAFEEFVQTFDEEPAASKGKVWVKAGTFNAGTREETTKEKGQLYKPSSRFEPSERKPSPEPTRSRIERIVRKKDGKKKSNLELFKEELKRIQEEREERHRLKEQMKEATSSGRVSRFDTPELPPITPSPLSLDVPNPYGSFDSGDPTTTNLYLGNLSPKLSEQRLMEIFGRYGPLASIKIMWPRNDEERLRGRNCGFVAFMTRRDAEAALEDLSGKDVEGYEMKLGWGKGVPIPPQPIYIPPALIEVSKPPPPSGLPFNAQPRKKDKEKLPLSDQMPEDPAAMEQFNKMLQRAVVKVVIPTERAKLMVVHRMVEFVVREGPLFEAMIMNKEIDNDMYRFLFENQSADHIYYRWKLYSLLHGDSPQRWRTDEFRMFKGGSVWKPPPMNPYMMDRDHHKKPEPESKRNKLLSASQRVRFESQLRHIAPERDVIAEIMVWCLDHADSAEEICLCITEALSTASSRLTSKISRLYLVSDILHNCTVKVANASKFRKCFQEKLPEMFEGIHETYSAVTSRLRAEAFKQRVMRVFRAWEDWAIYPQDFLIKLQNTFLGFNKQTEGEAGGDDSDDVDGAPLSDSDDVDGVPLDGAALLKKARRQGQADAADDDDDVDGVPLEEVDGSAAAAEGPSAARTTEAPGRAAGGFVPSRWETVDPHEVAAGAVTTSKWEAVAAAPSPAAPAAADSDGDEDVDGVPLDEPADEDSRSQGNTNTAPGSPVGDASEQRRVKLREVELKVMAYQDDLESGQRSVKTGYTLQEQVQHYRAKLMRKAERQLSDRKRRRDRSASSSDGESHHSYPSRRRSRSPKADRPRRRSRSHSPRRRRRSKSPSHRRSRSRSPPHRRSRSRSRSRSPSRKIRKKSKR